MDIPSLSKVLPQLWKQVDSLARELEAGTYVDWPSLSARLEFLNDAEMIDLISSSIPGWQKIATLHDGITAHHTILVLAICMNLPAYKAAIIQTQLEIQWAALLHDIDKDVTGGKDASHPFRSAAVAVKAMPGLGFELQPNVTLKDIESWSKLVMSAQREINGQVLHDHTHLKEIVEEVHRQWGNGTSASRILKAILFHQSLPTLNAWPGPVLLTNEELLTSITLEDLNVLDPLLIADSDSWNIFANVRSAYLDELRANIAKTRKLYRF